MKVFENIACLSLELCKHPLRVLHMISMDTNTVTDTEQLILVLFVF
jgi:hypothetical protein